MPTAEIGIIGGTGVYDPQLLSHAEEVRIKTPFGAPSDAIMVGDYEGRRLAILPRHARDHSIAPHQINNRANIWALKSLGVTRILSPSAVGSLREDIPPGTFVLVDQFIDRTWGRRGTFYETNSSRQHDLGSGFRKGNVAHVSVAEPMCPEIRGVAQQQAQRLRLPVRPAGTYICIQGPRFSTRAESAMYRQWGSDVIGMTLVPECVLAREAEICYAGIAMVTDWDVWKESHVTIQEVLQTMKQNEEKVKQLLAAVIPQIPETRSCPCKDAMKEALL